MTNVLTVCTANVCRSVVAAAQLDSMFASVGLDDVIQVGSRGVRAQDGYPACPRGFELADLEIPTHASRRLSVGDVEAAQLILTAEAQHRGAVVTLLPRARSRAFTMTEAAALSSWYLAQVRESGPLSRPPLERDAETRLAWWASELNDSRGVIPVRQLDIGDPHLARPGRDAHPDAVRAIRESMASVMSGLGYALMAR